MEQDLPDSYHPFYYGYLFLLAAWLPVLGNAALVLLLLLLSGLISGSEVAFFSLNHKDYEDFEKEDSPAARRILNLARQPRTLLATILIANNFINIAIVLVSDRLVNQLLPPEVFAKWGKALQARLQFVSLSVEELAHVFNFIITVIGVTFLLVLFGEVAPKIYAAMNRRKFALGMSAPLLVLMKVFSPLSKLLVNGTNLVEKRLAKIQGNNGLHTKREDIDQAIDLTLKESKSAKTEKNKDISQEMKILKRITTFSEVPVRRIMRSRMDIVAIEYNTPYPEVLNIIRESGYSRLPVYEEDLDNIRGLLYAKDLIDHLNESDFNWRTLIRETIFEPETKKINDMLQVFKEKHLHMAIIVDEYGGTAGLITLEDILEEIVGEIRDEFDKEEKSDFQKINDSTFIFDGKTQLHEFFKKFDIDEETFDDKAEEVDTLAGLILEIAGDFPKEKQTIRYKDTPYSFTILKMDKRRIEKVRVKILSDRENEKKHTKPPREKS